MWRVVFLIVGLSLAWNLTVTQQSESADAEDEMIQRGQYLVEHVAMCVMCHTPRNEQGELDRTRLLQGAPMPVESPFPNQQWAFKAPKLVGLHAWTEEEFIRFLQTGKNPSGRFAQPPMPPFRMTQEDAAAVVAYLKSLK